MTCSVCENKLEPPYNHVPFVAGMVSRGKVRLSRAQFRVRPPRINLTTRRLRNLHQQSHFPRARITSERPSGYNSIQQHSTSHDNVKPVLRIPIKIAIHTGDGHAPRDWITSTQSYPADSKPLPSDITSYSLLSSSVTELIIILFRLEAFLSFSVSHGCK